MTPEGYAALAGILVSFISLIVSIRTSNRQHEHEITLEGIKVIEERNSDLLKRSRDRENLVFQKKVETLHEMNLHWGAVLRYTQQILRPLILTQNWMKRKSMKN